MDHATYLESYLALTSPALGEIALQLARGDHEEATASLTALRSDQDALWETFRASASAGVNP